MRSWILLLVVWIAYVEYLVANPIVVDHSERPIQMLSESVEIEVGDLKSSVSGVYRFRQTEDETPKTPDVHVLLLVPVFIPEELADFTTANSLASPTAIIRDKKYIPVDGRPVWGNGWKVIRQFPRKAKLVIFEIYIPRSEIDDVFEVSIQYTQPHFKGSFSTYSLYCPIIWPVDPAKAAPTKASDFTVTFRPMEERRLKLLSRNKGVIKNSPDEVSVQAANLENIVVKVSPRKNVSASK
jgi:hypothetical protein